MIVNSPLLSHLFFFKHKVSGISHLPPGDLACISRATGDLPVEKESKGVCGLLYWELCLDEQ